LKQSFFAAWSVLLFFYFVEVVLSLSNSNIVAFQNIINGLGVWHCVCLILDERRENVDVLALA